MKKAGIIVNPYAGIGGSVALKGSDGAAIVEKALSLGAEQKAPGRARLALEGLKSISGEIELITCPGEMGASEAAECGLKAGILDRRASEGRTTAEDTKYYAAQMVEMGVDLILFAGGDGTARDILDATGENVPVVGIPAGTKMHSSVYALSPQAAGRLAAEYLTLDNSRTTEAEVMDIDEEAFRHEIVQAKLYGYLRIPDIPNMFQGMKGGGHTENEQAALAGIAEDVIKGMQEDVYYIMGSGSTVRAVMDRLGLESTLLGIDIVKNKALIAKDVTEKQILEIIGEAPAKIVVTPIGGQGFIFGRGNQQISHRVIRKAGKNNIIVIGTQAKLTSLPNQVLRVDTGDVETDRMLAGAMRVTAGKYGIIVIRVAGVDDKT